MNNRFGKFQNTHFNRVTLIMSQIKNYHNYGNMNFTDKRVNKHQILVPIYKLFNLGHTIGLLEVIAETT